MELIKVFIIVSGPSGPVIVPLKVHGTELQIEDGAHYRAAEAAATWLPGCSVIPAATFDEHDPAGKQVINAFDWEKVSEVFVLGETEKGLEIKVVGYKPKE